MTLLNQFYFSKKVKVLEQLIEMIQNFPLEDPVYDKLQDDLEKIRGRFKQVCDQFHCWNTNCNCVQNK